MFIYGMWNSTGAGIQSRYVFIFIFNKPFVIARNRYSRLWLSIYYCNTSQICLVWKNQLFATNWEKERKVARYVYWILFTDWWLWYEISLKTSLFAPNEILIEAQLQIENKEKNWSPTSGTMNNDVNNEQVEFFSVIFQVAFDNVTNENIT